MYRSKVQYLYFFLLPAFVGTCDSRKIPDADLGVEILNETTIVQCPPWEEGHPTYYPYPYDCRKFIECTNGVPIVHICPPVTVWDQALLTCNHESFTPCVIVTTELPIFTSTIEDLTTTKTTPTTTTPTTTTPTTTTPTTTTPATTTPTTTTPTTTTPTTTTPTTTTSTTTTPTPTTPTTTTPTTTTPTTTTPTTTTPTTTTPTTTTPTTTTPTTTTPTTTTPTTTTPTTTRPTTTTPTTTAPTTTTPTTTTLTTTRPTTTTPTTTRPASTTPTTPTCSTKTPVAPQTSPIQTGVEYTIINKQCNSMALSVYKSILDLSNEGNIHTIPHVQSCSDLSQVFKLQLVSGNTYQILSALGTGTEQWRWRMHLHTTLRPFPTLYTGQADYAKFTLQLADASNFYTVRVLESPQTSFYYSGIPNDIGVELRYVNPPNPTNHTHLWGFVRCPA